MNSGRSEKFAWSVFVGAIVAYVLLSAPMLAQLGIPYDLPTGPVIAKLHPATYLLMFSWFLALAGQGNPLRTLGMQARQSPLLITSLGCMLLVFIWVVWRHGSSGAAFIIEALWTPVIALLVIELLEPGRQKQIVLVIVALLLLNACVALGEVMLHKRVAFLGKIEIGFVEPYFRASALFGHPLQNALITVSLLPAVLLLPWPVWLRTGAIVLMMLSVLTFGGRSSLFVCVAVYGLALILWTARSVLRGRFNYLQLTGGSLFVMLGATVLAGIVAGTGLGARIFNNLELDSSASVRFKVWDAFNFVSGSDLWIGIPPAAIDHVSLRMGLDPVFEAIENFWIYLLLQFGIIGYVPFLIGLGCLLFLLWRSSPVPMRLALVVYLIVASTNNTLAAKTISLLLLSVAAFSSRAFARGTINGVPLVGALR